ncbi:MAG: hypothetical protein J0I20_16850 [Chloroflexi bacterium]|nr:hypothetical protein [Chloroflexota bacterium]
MYNKLARFNGPRCACCGVNYQPRMLRDGTMSQTCGQTACVSRWSRKKGPANTGLRGFNARAI